MSQMHYFSYKFLKLAKLGSFRPQRFLIFILETWSSVIWPNSGFWS